MNRSTDDVVHAAVRDSGAVLDDAAERDGTAARVDLAVLGPVSVHRAGQGPVTVTSPRTRGLLVALALADGRSVSVPQLAEELWADEAAPLDPRGSVQTVVSRLRAVVGPGLVERTPGGYRFAGTTDLQVASGALRAATAALARRDPVRAVGLATAALDLWRGEPGADVGGSLREQLEPRAGSLRSRLGEVLLDALVVAEDWDGALALVTPRLAQDPADERSVAALLAACAGTGDVTTGLRAYARLRDALADELGTSPSPAVQERYAALLRLDASGHGSSDSGASDPVAPAPGTSSPRGTSVGLRRAATTLVGRERAVADLVAHLGGSRLVTVLGPGGLGKTRIAHEVGWRLLDDGAPLVVVVELASIGTAEDVVPAIAAALGIHEATTGVRLGDRGKGIDVLAQMRERLGAPGTVLVLDNCEHVLEGAARAVDDLLESTAVRVLATSRAPLEVDGEIAYALAALGSDPAGHGPAVELFCQRARAVRGDVVLDLSAVARLCDRLDGLPLAIELAAARVRSMTVEEIDDRLGARFLLLTGGARTAPERHRTLRAVIEWSWDLLGPGERATLRRTSLLPAGFDLATAEQVAGAGWPDGAGRVPEQVREDVATLVAQSLLVMTEDPRTRTSRFRMLETVREFSLIELERAGEVADGRRAVVAWARGLAARGVSAMMGPGQPGLVRTTVREQDNLVQAFRWAVAEQDGTSALAVFGLLGAVSGVRGTFFELFGLVDDALALAPRAHLEQARDAILTAFVVAGVGRMFVTRRLATVIGRLRLLSRRPDLVGEDWAEAVRLGLAGATGQDHQEVGARARGSSSPTIALLGHLAGGAFAENSGALDEAAALGERAHELAVVQGNLWAQASASQLLGQVENERGDHGAAARWFTAAHRLMIELGSVSDLRQIEISEAGNDLVEGDLDRAEAVFRQAAATTADEVVAPDNPLGGTEPGVAEHRAAGFAGLGEVAWLRGDPAGALDSYDRCLEQLPGRGAQGSRPWHLVHAAARLCLASLDAVAAAGSSAGLAGDGRGTADERGSAGGAANAGVGADAGMRAPVRDRDARLDMARRLRVRVVAGLRTGTEVDSPVVGTALVALGAWLWSDGGSNGGKVGDRSAVDRSAVDRSDDGLELLALAERLGSRQDVPSLRRTTHLAAARRLLGDARVDAAVRRAQEPAAHDEVLARAREILRPRLA